MAHAQHTSTSSTRRSLRLLTAERKTTNVDEEEEQSTARQAKSVSSKRRSEAEIDPHAEPSSEEEQPTRRKRSHSKPASSSHSLKRRKRNQKSSPQPFKRPRQSSSSSDGEERSSAPTLPNRTRSQSHHHRKGSRSTSEPEGPETGNLCVRRGGRDLHLATGQSASTTTPPAALGNARPCHSAAPPLPLFHSSAYYQQASSASSSSAQAYSGVVPPSSYHSPLVASTLRPPKSALAMSTESDTESDHLAAASGASSAALFHSLSGRVQHLMSRVGAGSHSLQAMHGRLQQYLQGLQSPDADVRLSTLNELCSLLVMSNEETLPGFQFRLLFPLLRDCLAEAHAEIALTACRALTYLLEALPRSASQIAEGTPLLLSKLRSITSIDLAEQALTVLEMLSKRHGKPILLADGIAACLEYLDFFSLTSQNKALAIVANCCLHVLTRPDFNCIRAHLDNLGQRLRSEEKKTLEHVCSIFARLVENFHRDATVLREIASPSLLKTFQSLLVLQPSLLNSPSFVSILHMLYIFSAYSPTLAVTLLKMNLSETILALLTGSTTKAIIPIVYKSAALSTNDLTPTVAPSVELLPRTPQELYEIVSLIGEMLPRLPPDDPLFQVEQYFRRGSLSRRSSDSSVLWHWQDEQGQLQPYSLPDSRTIERAWQQHEDELQLQIAGRPYLLDLQQLQQINEESHQARFIKRLLTAETDSSPPSTDARLEMLHGHPELAHAFIQSLFAVLYEVYNSSAGPAVKHRCLHSLLRMLYYAPGELLEQQLLRQQPISSHIASMLAAADYKIVVSALQMAEILMRKLPAVFAVAFCREGVLHQLEILLSFVLPASTRVETRAQRAKCEEFAARSGRAAPLALTSQEKAKLKEWIQSQARAFRASYFAQNASNSSLVTRLTSALENLHVGRPLPENSEALREIATIIAKGDVSPFEMVHSGLITKLFQYLTDDLSVPNDRPERLKEFLAVFLDLSRDELAPSRSAASSPLARLISKLHGCVNQLEQFPIRVNDLGGRPAHSSALRLLTSQQLKCHLVRHPQCKALKQWNSGPVKIDPLALVSAIEKYLLLRGIASHATREDASHALANEESEVSNESDAEDVLSRSATMRLEFLLNEHVIPPNMTIYQAVRLYSSSATTTTPRTGEHESETDNDESIFASAAGLWTRVHTLHYRPALHSAVPAVHAAIGSANNSTRLRRPLSPKKTIKPPKLRATLPPTVDELWSNGQTPRPKSLLTVALNESISSLLTINDLSLNAVALLRILHGLNLHWADLYAPHSAFPLLAKSDFHSAKLTAKVNRQLQDPLVILMGQIPAWITELGYSCLFLFPFETRQLLFYPCAFDRERAMQRLLDSGELLGPPASASEPPERQSLVPRLERKKVQLTRARILAEMEQLLDGWTSRHFLEVQYEDEVGFGLGPTLEAYSLLSKELQKNGLELWRTETSSTEYVEARHGLFPAPLGRQAKASTVTRVRQKFKFLGKLMAKALMDSRMLDMPFSEVFYKWLLGQEESLALEDLAQLDGQFYEQLKRLQSVVQQRSERLDGCRIEDLALVFTLPGYPQIELKKGGKDCAVTRENLEQYIDLVVHWTLIEGVRRQFESFRDGFNSIFALHHLKCFSPDELHQVFCGSASTAGWEVKTLAESTRCDHGYTPSSRAVQWLFELLSQFEHEEQRAFLQFVTGSPRLPVGGFRMLHPPLTIVRKTAESSHDSTDPDAFLPSVMTCVNYLKLPDYSSKEIMRAKLHTAIRDGQNAFLLS